MGWLTEPFSEGFSPSRPSLSGSPAIVFRLFSLKFIMDSSASICAQLHPDHFVLALLLALNGGGLAQDQPSDLSLLLNEARSLINEDKPSAAIQKLQASHQTSNPKVAYLLGVAYYHVKDYIQAIDQLSPNIEKLPEDSLEQREAIQVLGMCKYLAGRLTEAIPFLEKTSAWAADNSETAYVLGMAYGQTHEPGKARESFARLFRVAPDSAAAHVITAQMMIRIQIDDLAENELKQALQKDPRIPQANFLLGELAIFQGKLDEGIALMNREIELNPGNGNAFYRLGDAYARQLNWDEAVGPLKKSIWLNPYFSAPYVLLGKTYMKKDQLNTAEGVLRRAVEMDPNNKSAHYLLAQTLQRLGRQEEAKREFESAQRLHAVPER
jgi:tetratricopeptide (TPR) repeat protein